MILKDRGPPSSPKGQNDNMRRKGKCDRTLVEPQCKAINTKQPVTINHIIHVTGVLHAITCRSTRTVKSGERRRAGLGSQLSTHGDPMSVNPPVHGQVVEGADNLGAEEQGRPVRQNVYRITDHNSTGVLLAKDSLKRTARKKIRKIKEMRSKVRTHLNIGTNTTLITHTDTQKTLSHTMAKRQKQLIYQLKIRLLPRMNRVGLSKYWLISYTISILSSGLLIQEEEMNMKFQQ
ncbi:hypothetical protein GH733_011918 [Mirounga leonina]|nr:hypothetical protein GH733_011918 [Mirounga leonina]